MTGKLTWAIDEPLPTPPPRGAMTLRGWAFARDGSTLTGVRAWIGQRLFVGRFGIARPDIAATREHLFVPLECGFEIPLTDAEGIVDLRLEVELQADSWQHLANVPVTFAHNAFETHIDTIRQTGGPEGDVIAEGWAAHPTRPARKLYLLSGGKRFQCEMWLARPDLRALPWAAEHVFYAGFRAVVPAHAIDPQLRVMAEYVDGGTDAAKPASIAALNRAAGAAASDGLATEAELLDRLRALVSHIPPLDGPPAISVLTPLYRTKLPWIVQLAASLRMQTRPDWEWCLVDDGSRDRTLDKALAILEEGAPRIRVKRERKNGGISAATNAALKIARARYAACVDHDDLLAPCALERSLQVLESSGADAVYSDSDKIDDAGLRFEPFYKPAWSPEYFRGVMYVGHLLCFDTGLAREVGGFDSAYDKLQDYEFFLRFSERASEIEHIPLVLYHWRAVPESIAASPTAKGSIAALQERAVQAHLERLAVPARALAAHSHFVVLMPNLRASRPKISIIIPTRDAPEVLERCLSTLFARTSYENFEVVVVDNETSDPRALRAMRSYPVKRVLYNGRFNFSRENNAALLYCEGEYIVLLNNDIEIVTAEWLERLLYYAEQPDVGAVGPLLLYPNDTVQHAGVVLGPRGTADHKLRGASPRAPGYAGTLVVSHEVSAVTGACLMTSRARYENVGGLVEYYWTAYQDVDLCLQYRAQGLRNIFVPSVALIHHESYSRKDYYDHVDRALLLDRFGETIAAGDPYYNRNFNLERADYS